MFPTFGSIVFYCLFDFVYVFTKGCVQELFHSLTYSTIGRSQSLEVTLQGLYVYVGGVSRLFTHKEKKGLLTGKQTTVPVTVSDCETSQNMEFIYAI